jgi:hypothetical protein
MTKLDLESIQALANEDYTVHSGWTTDIYLDPRSGKVYTHTGQNSVPEDAYHGIDRRILTVYPNAIGLSVARAVEAVSEKLQEILDNFKGTEWNGQNHIGIWNVSGGLSGNGYPSEEPPEIWYYSDPCDWFEGSEDDIKESWRLGRTAADHVERCCGLTNGPGEECREDEAIEYVDRQFKQFNLELLDIAKYDDGVDDLPGDTPIGYMLRVIEIIRINIPKV